MTRTEAATALCRSLNEEVSRMAPPGIGRDEKTWTTVGAEDAAFMIALSSWERAGGGPEKAALKDAYWNVLRAWRDAIRQFERQGAA